MPHFLPSLALIDQLPKIESYPFTVDHADFFRAAKPLIAEGEPIIELPITGADAVATGMALADAW